jgi:hypothetical protein
MIELTINTDLSQDISDVALYTLGISLLRFSLSGIVNSWLKDAPCLFKIFSRDIHSEQNRRKLHENLWYALHHTTRYVYFPSVA